MPEEAKFCMECGSSMSENKSEDSKRSKGKSSPKTEHQNGDYSSDSDEVIGETLPKRKRVRQRKNDKLEKVKNKGSTGSDDETDQASSGEEPPPKRKRGRSADKNGKNKKRSSRKRLVESSNSEQEDSAEKSEDSVSDKGELEEVKDSEEDFESMAEEAEEAEEEIEKESNKSDEDVIMIDSEGSSSSEVVTKRVTRSRRGKQNGDSKKSKGKKSEKSGKITCTVCQGSYHKGYIYSHPLLKVATCRKCVKDWMDTDWPKDEDGYDEYCRWTMKSSKSLWLCDSCTRVFDGEAVKENLGEEVFNKIDSGDSWNCLVCDPSQLDGLEQDYPVYGRKKKKVPAGSPKEKAKGKYRRNIKAVLNDDELSEATKKAMKTEKDRLKYLKDLEVKHAKQGAEYDKGGPVCLNPFHPETEDPIFVCDEIGNFLKKHQKEGIRFMWNNITDKKKEKKEDGKEGKAQFEGTGCILGHLMGLGKTLQTITVVQAYLAAEIGRTVMIMAPVNVLTNWRKEFEKWLDDDSMPPIVCLGEGFKTSKDRMRGLEKWHRRGGVLIVGLEMMRNLCEGKRIKSKRMREKFQMYLLEEADLVVVDEGHRIKNEKSRLSKTLNMIGTKRRVVLTGTPLQNNLMEYYCMIDFVRPIYLGTNKDFRNRFQTPILNGQCVDSTKEDAELMRERAFILHSRVKGFVHRRGYLDIAHELPQKYVYTLFVALSPLQKKLYRSYLSGITRKSLFMDYHALNKIWNHPSIIQTSHKQWRVAQQKKHDLAMEREFLDEEDEEEEESDVELSYTEDEDKMNQRSRERAEQIRVKNAERARKTSERKAKIRALLEPPSKNGMVHDWFKEHFPAKQSEGSGSDGDGKEYGLISQGPKFQVTLELIQRVMAQGEKVLIFSQSLFVLDLLEEMLGDLLDFDRHRDYFRLDGSVGSQLRQKDIDVFNRPKSRQKVFLLSTKAGSLGINLVGANHAIIFDSSWNPSHDLQAVFRIYRFGQRKNVYVYRLVSHKTMEQKIYERQLTKRGLALRVVDEQQVQRHFMQRDLQELYAFDMEDGKGFITHPRPGEKKDEAVLKVEEEVKAEDGKDGVEESEKDVNGDAKVEEKMSIFNPYEGCRKELPQGSLMWWLLARYGEEDQKKDAIQALDAYQKSVKIENDLQKSTPKKKKKKKKSEEDDESYGEESEEEEYSDDLVVTEEEAFKAKMSLVKTAKAKDDMFEPNHLIHGFHMPKVLLEHIDTETLNDEQRKKALENFEKSLEDEKRAKMGYGAGSLHQQAQFDLRLRLIALPPPPDWPVNSHVYEMAQWQQAQVMAFLDRIQMPFLKALFAERIVNGGQLFFLHNKSMELEMLQPQIRGTFLKLLCDEVMTGNASFSQVWDIHFLKENGHLYFYNKLQQASQWDKPLELRYDFGAGQSAFYANQQYRTMKMQQEQYARQQQQQQQMMYAQPHYPPP